MQETLIIMLLLAAGVVITIYKGINIVPQGEEWVVERLGKFSRTLKPGLNIIIPYLDAVRQKVSTRYGIEDFQLAIQQLVMTTLRSILGEMTLDEALSNREHIKAKLKDAIIDDVADWGVTVKSVEIQDISPSASMQDSMERQAAAERERRAIETTAEGNKNAAILEADGKLEAAKREAEAQIALANASAEAIRLISDNIQDKELPAMFLLGDRYINSLEQISKSQNSKFVIYPADIQSAIKGMLGNTFKK